MTPAARRRLLWRAAGLPAALLLAAVLGGRLLLALSLPPVEGQVALPGLDAPVTVHFDRWQRPYVAASNLEDALAAEGWLHASHRLWQMELLRRAGQGRMAELLGADLLDTDRMLWRTGVPQLAARLEANARPATLALVDRYLVGVNAAIDGYRVLPPEFLLLTAPRPRWQRRDVFALGALMAYQSANNQQNELLRLALKGRLAADEFSAFSGEEPPPADYPYALPAAAGEARLLRAIDALALTDPAANPSLPSLAFGSNGWVVAPQRSANGSALYAFDSHDELGLPDLFYEVHLFSGERQLRGWSVAGLPGVINGFNENIAWGFTNIGDTQDLFLEQRSAEDPGLFRDGQDWYRATTQHVTIPVKGGAAESLTITYTRNGPLVSEDPPISLAWAVQYLPQPRLDSLLDFNLAQDWDSFNAALDAFPAPTLNATYADIQGTIGLRTAGRIPRRGRGQGLLPLDGSEPGNRWQGMVPAAAMPRAVNPAEGFLAAANARVNAPGEGPLVSADNAPPYRSARIREALSTPGRLDADAMQRLQADWLDSQAAMLLPALLRQIEAARPGPEARRCLPLLLAWAENPVAAPDSAAALVFQQWYLALAEELFAARLGELYPRLLDRAYLLNDALDRLVLGDGRSPWWAGDRPGRVAAALERAAGHLEARFGPEPGQWRLDRALHVRLWHPLGRAVPVLGLLFDEPARPWGGSTATVGRARYEYRSPFAVSMAATVRAVAEMGMPPRVRSVIPGGQSGHPLSPHYADQFPGWLAGELYEIAVGPDDVAGTELQLLPTR